ncbi:alpha/beta hydrolase [Listeria sp. PSOL-1]|uniref:alpha/beta hydrolase n=1 Tax=Listeria sp. PSOL-1 TaxID=1844999 RepID=UPI0013D783F8|nr:alpha/beta hydrolase [Listeria sp. PSOL-1]
MKNLLIKKIMATLCVMGILFSSMLGGQTPASAQDIQAKSLSLHQLTESLVTLTFRDQLSPAKKEEIVNLVENKANVYINEKNANKPTNLKDLDPDAYAQVVENLFKDNLAIVDSPGTALVALALIVAEWEFDRTYYETQQALVDITWATYTMYDYGFIRNSLLNAILQQYNYNPINPSPSGYEKRTVNVPEFAGSSQTLNLSGFYKDNNSDTTIVAIGGFRGNGWPDPTDEDFGHETKMLESFGYNVLLTEPRASGESEGEFITMGFHEKDDYTAFINDELAKNPQQKIVLYGGSMGSSTALGSLANSYSDQVKGVISISGYKSIKAELDDLLNALEIDATTRLLILTNLESRYLIPRANLNLQDEVPMQGVKSSEIPKLFLHGDADKFVLPGNAESLKDNAIGDQNYLYYIPGGTHSNLFSKDGTENTAFIKEHIDQFLNDLPLKK